jgi:predicted dinucleotide-binding enzyme
MKIGIIGVGNIGGALGRRLIEELESGAIERIAAAVRGRTVLRLANAPTD